MSWRSVIAVHPAADAFPTMSEDELRALGDDIKRNGQRQPIVVGGGPPQVVIDGRSRLDAMELVGMQVHDEVGFTSQVKMTILPIAQDPVAAIVSLNLVRRHLSESERAMIAAKLATMRQGERTDLPSIDGMLSQADAAKLLNVSTKSVERAASVRREGSPELVSALERGEVPVSRAAAVAKEPPAAQRPFPARQPPPLPQRGPVDGLMRGVRRLTIEQRRTFWDLCVQAWPGPMREALDCWRQTHREEEWACDAAE